MESPEAAWSVIERNRTAPLQLHRKVLRVEYGQRRDNNAVRPPRSTVVKKSGGNNKQQALKASDGSS